MNQKKLIHVAVGVIKHPDKGILISRRQEGQHLAGLWEFPGGKVEDGESVEQALVRELKEELDIDVYHSAPLIKIAHHYPEKSVLLDVHIVDEFSDTARGVEGQALRWVEQGELKNVEFPDANKSIINALNLPDCLAISDDFDSFEAFKNFVQKQLANQIKFIQIRSTNSQWREWLDWVLEYSRECQIALNSGLAGLDLSQSYSVGLHLKASDLAEVDELLLTRFSLVGASCHNEEEILRANELGLDYILISPVLATKSHPDAESLGWQRFTELVEIAHMPAFALGGLDKEKISLAKKCGAQGIAGISCFS